MQRLALGEDGSFDKNLSRIFLIKNRVEEADIRQLAIRTTKKDIL